MVLEQSFVFDFFFIYHGSLVYFDAMQDNKLADFKTNK